MGEYARTQADMHALIDAVQKMFAAIGEVVIATGVALCTAMAEFWNSPAGQLMREYARSKLREPVEDEWERVSVSWSKRYSD